MTDDASLTDFFESEDADDDSSAAEEGEEAVDDESVPNARDADDETGDADDEAGEADADDGAVVSAAAAEPADVTYAWDTEGGPCAACGERSERRWIGDEGLVCPDCKDW